MAQRPAPLNMNKPSSAETQAKPNSARRHHSRTGQEALELLLASRDELHRPPPPPCRETPVPKVNCPSKKDNGFKKKKEEKKNLQRFFSVLWFSIIVRVRRRAFKIPLGRRESEGDAGEFGRWNRRTWSQAARSEGSEVVTLIGSEVCLVAAASASRAAAEMSEGYEPWSLAQSGKFKPKCVWRIEEWLRVAFISQWCLKGNQVRQPL